MAFQENGALLEIAPNDSNVDTENTQGEVTNNGDGTLDYNPNGQFESLSADETATDTFTYTVSDGNGGTDTATVTITIDGVDDLPNDESLIQPDSASATSEFSSSFDIGNTIDGSGLPINFSSSDAHADYTGDNHWTTASGQGVGAIATFVFDEAATLDAFALWNHRSNNIAFDPFYAVTQFDLVFKDINGTELLSLPDQVAVGNTATAQIYEFEPVVGVRSVEFTIDANEGSRFSGVAEVAFNEANDIPSDKTFNSFGRGWSFIGDIEAVTDQEGNVIIENPAPANALLNPQIGNLISFLISDQLALELQPEGNLTPLDSRAQRFFELQGDGSYESSPGDFATLTENGATLQLREKDGTIFSFQADGRLDFVEDRNGNRATAEYTDGLLTNLSNDEGDSLTFAYNDQDRVTSVTDEEGRVFNYSYDETGELLSSVTTLQGTTSYTYNDNFDLTSVTAPDGVQRNFEYDSQGRLTQRGFNEGIDPITYNYNDTENVIVTDGTGSEVTLGFDNGALERFEAPLERSLAFEFDDDGNLTRVIGPGNTVTELDYDDQGNPIGVTDPLGGETELSYEPTFSQLASLTDSRGNAINYNYDDRGNLLEIARVDGTSQNFSYNNNGNLIELVNRRGEAINLTYDNRERITRLDNSDSTFEEYIYNNRGNIVSVATERGTTSLTYDNADRLTEIVYPSGRSLSYSYDTVGRRTQLIDQDGNTVNYSYDEAGRLAELTNGDSELIVGYTYNERGQVAQEENGNDTSTSYSYDATGQILEIINRASDNSINSRFAYTYDDLGLRVGASTPDGDWTYSYDASGQLTGAIFNSTNPEIPDQNLTYEYDSVGNRVRVVENGTTTQYNTNNLNQYAGVGETTFEYDADGNLISKTSEEGTWTFSYNDENQLVSVTEPNGTVTEYEYDAFGNRVASIRDGERTEFLIDLFGSGNGLSNVVAEYDGNGNLTAQYTHGLGLVSRADAGDNTAYYNTDGIGSVTSLTGASGDTLNRYSYLPFGENLSETEAIDNSFEFIGQWGVAEDANGLHFMRNRYYSSELGRFTAEDPIGLNGGDVNLYRYVSNQPSFLIDPIGLADWSWNDFTQDTVTTAVAGAAGGAVTGAITTGGLASGPAAGVGAAAGAVTGAAGYTLNYLWDEFLPSEPEREQLPESDGPIPSPQPPEPPQPPELPGPPIPPENDGGLQGDPHLVTFDGLSYSFQAAGEFNAIESTTDDFEIQARFEPIAQGVSVTTALATLVDGQRVGFYSEGGSRVEIGDQIVTIENGESIPVGDSRIFREGNSFTLVYAGEDNQINDGDNQLFVRFLGSGDNTVINFFRAFIDDNLAGNIQGLLGNSNDDRADDVALPDGTVLERPLQFDQLYGEYRDAFRIQDVSESFFNYEEGNGPDTFFDPNFPEAPVTVDTLDPDERAAAEEIVRNAGIPEGTPAFDAAVLDLALTGETGFIEGAADRPPSDEEIQVETLLVNNTSDSGAGSLRQAIAEANANPGMDVITLNQGLSGETINLINGPLVITDDINIQGAGTEDLTIDAQGNNRVFVIDDGDDNNTLEVEIGGLTITGGIASGDAPDNQGGGIFNQETLLISNTTISGNSADVGGGIFNSGTVILRNSTLSENSATNAGGAINNDNVLTVSNSTISDNAADTGGGISNDGTATLVNATLSDNAATSQGGGIANNGSLTLANSIVANSQSSGDIADTNDGITLAGVNLIEDSSITGNSVLNAEPLLGTLQDNEGSTFTQIPEIGSPAINAGNNAFLSETELGVDLNGDGEISTDLITDQRGTGFDRFVGEAVDLGAIENQAPVAENDSFSTDEDTAFTTGNVLDNDSDPEGNAFSVSAINTENTQGEVTNNEDGTFEYNPNGQFENLAVGETATDSFSYTVSDGNGGTDTATVTVTIEGVADNNTTSPTVELSVEPSSGSENNQTAFTLTATASEAVTGEQTVEVTTSGVDGDDFTEELPTAITIADGESSGEVTLTVADDSEVEGEETATFAISEISDGLALGANTSVEFAIEDNEESVPADLNEDGFVNLDDLGILAATFGLSEGEANYNPVADLANDDGLINNDDLGVFAASFG